MNWNWSVVCFTDTSVTSSSFFLFWLPRWRGKFFAIAFSCVPLVRSNTHRSDGATTSLNHYATHGRLVSCFRLRNTWALAIRRWPFGLIYLTSISRFLFGMHFAPPPPSLPVNSTARSKINSPKLLGLVFLCIKNSKSEGKKLEDQVAWKSSWILSFKLQ